MRPYLDLDLSPTVVERWSLFPVHFLYKLDCSCTKSGLWKQGVAVHSDHLDQFLLHQIRSNYDFGVQFSFKLVVAR